MKEVIDYSKNDTEEQKVDRARIVELYEKMRNILNQVSVEVTDSVKVCDLNRINERMSAVIDLDRFEPEMDKAAEELELILRKYDPDHKDN